MKNKDFNGFTLLDDVFWKKDDAFNQNTRRN